LYDLALFIEEHASTILQNLLGPDTRDILRSAVQALHAGVTEETVKGSGLLLLFLLLREKFASVTHGIVYGALIGAGFALVENFSYFAISPRNLLPYLIVGKIILGWLGIRPLSLVLGLRWDMYAIREDECYRCALWQGDPTILFCHRSGHYRERPTGSGLRVYGRRQRQR